VLSARRRPEGGDGAGEHDCALRFQNQWWDAESGLHYNLHRHYDPGSGQYLCVDAIGLGDGPRTHARDLRTVSQSSMRSDRSSAVRAGYQVRCDEHGRGDLRFIS
jgi:RHS repeat-associated protein